MRLGLGPRLQVSRGKEDLPPPANESGLPEELRSMIDTKVTGDFDKMVKRRIIHGDTFNRHH